MDVKCIILIFLALNYPSTMRALDEDIEGVPSTGIHQEWTPPQHQQPHHHYQQQQQHQQPPQHSNTLPQLNNTADELLQLVRICMQLNISHTKCSCNITPTLCDVTAFIYDVTTNVPSYTYSRRGELTVVYASVTLLASLFGLIGNGFVILVAYKQRKNLAKFKLHIAELACVNFLFSAVQIMNTLPLFYTNKWIYGVSMCKLIRSIFEFCSLLTTEFFFIIAIERYMVVVYPLKSRCSNRKVTINALVVMGTLLAAATIIPYSIGLNIEEVSGRCIMFQGDERKLSLPYNLFLVIFYCILPVGTISLLNAKMLINIGKKKKNDSVILKGVVYERRLKRNRRIIHVTLLVLIAFILCTLPTRAFMIYLEIVNFEVQDMALYLTLAFIAYITYPLQSTLNPILYSMITKEWRKEMKALWEGKNVFGKSINKMMANIINRKKKKCKYDKNNNNNNNNNDVTNYYEICNGKMDSVHDTSSTS